VEKLWEDEWEAARGRGPDEKRGVAPEFIFGGLVGMLVLGLVWVTTAVVAGDEPKDGSGVAEQGIAALSQASPSVDQEVEEPTVFRTRLDRCRVAAERLAEPLRAADPAMDQWTVHVGAMNQLVVGAITVRQARDFWEQTRLGAIRKIDRFDDATDPVRRAGLNCPVSSRLGEASGPLRSCVHRVTADERTLEAAGTAIRRWQHHVHDMDRMRLGLLSPAAAGRMWVADWQKGVREIEAYQSEAKAARQSGQC
jgi:hypothetical protein